MNVHPELWEQWFKEASVYEERMYQAFKARLVREVIVFDQRKALASDNLPFTPARLKYRHVLLLTDITKGKNG